MNWAKRLVTLVLVVMLAMGAVTVFAHEHREVGEYALTFGWRVEPALVGFPNGPELTIDLHSEEEAGHEHAEGDEHAEADPMAGVEVSLQVEVTFGPATKTMPLELSWGTTNHFIADLIPTRPGDYTFRVFGTIGDLEVDEVFNSADGDFSSVAPSTDVTFPDAIPSVVELQEIIAALEARIAVLEG